MRVMKLLVMVNFINMSQNQIDEALDAELNVSSLSLKVSGFKGCKYFVYPNVVQETDYRTRNFVRK